MEQELHFKIRKQEKQWKEDFQNKIEQLKFQMMKLFSSWIEELSEILEQREQGFIKDGYEWRIDRF